MSHSRCSGVAAWENIRSHKPPIGIRKGVDTGNCCKEESLRGLKQNLKQSRWAWPTENIFSYCTSLFKLSKCRQMNTAREFWPSLNRHWSHWSYCTTFNRHETFIRPLLCCWISDICFWESFTFFSWLFVNGVLVLGNRERKLLLSVSFDKNWVTVHSFKSVWYIAWRDLSSWEKEMEVVILREG